MARPEYHPTEDRDRLFQNTLKDPIHGVRDHAILKLLYGYPIRPIELIRLKTLDIATDEGRVLPKRDRIMRAEVAFNGRERPMPILDPVLIQALEEWLKYRIEQGIGLTRTGFLDIEAPLFFRSKSKGFTVHTTNTESVIRHNSESINRVIRQRLKDNGLTGSVDSAIRTWTLDRHRGGADLRIIWSYRGDNDIESVKRIIRRDPVRLGALVEKIY